MVTAWLGLLLCLMSGRCCCWWWRRTAGSNQLCPADCTQRTSVIRQLPFSDVSLPLSRKGHTSLDWGHHWFLTSETFSPLWSFAFKQYLAAGFLTFQVIVLPHHWGQIYQIHSIVLCCLSYSHSLVGLWFSVKVAFPAKQLCQTWWLFTDCWVCKYIWQPAGHSSSVRFQAHESKEILQTLTHRHALREIQWPARTWTQAQVFFHTFLCAHKHSNNKEIVKKYSRKYR